MNCSRHRADLGMTCEGAGHKHEHDGLCWLLCDEWLTPCEVCNVNVTDMDKHQRVCHAEAS